MKKTSILLIIIGVLILTITVSLAVKPDLFLFRFEPKTPVKQISASVKENKMIREEKQDSKRLAKSLFVDKEFNKRDNDFKYQKEKLESEGLSYTYIAPNGIEIDGAGNVYVSDPANNLLRVYWPDGQAKGIIDFGVLGEYIYIKDWKVSKEGMVYVLTPDELFFSDFNGKSPVNKIDETFENAHLLYIGNNGNVSVLDISTETMNLRVRKYSKEGNLLNIFEQYHDELNLFDYEGSSNNLIKIEFLGGSCEEELQYVITNTSYPEKEYLVSFSRENENSIGGIFVIGIDNDDNLYFLKRLFKKNKQGSLYSVHKFSFEDEKLESHDIDDRKILPTEGLTDHLIKVDYSGNVYQLQTSEDKVEVKKYIIGK